MNDIAVSPITVIPQIGLSPHFPPINIAETNRKDVYVRIRMRQNYLVVGQSHIPLELFIRNPKLATIKEVLIKLVHCRQLGIAGTRETNSLPNRLAWCCRFSRSASACYISIAYSMLMGRTSPPLFTKQR